MNQLSVWELESFFAPADIIIAGSGFVGLWSAYYLKKHAPGLSITILERGLIPTGASTRNAGFACFGSLTELISDGEKMGEDKMLELVEMRYKGLRRISKLFRDKEIDFQRHGGYELIDGNNIDLNELRSQIDRLNRPLKKIVKLQKTFRMVDHKLPGFGFAGIRHLIENKAEGQLHSGKLCQALLQQVQSMGVTVLNNIEIKNYEKVNGHVLLHTNYPFSFTASQLLVCTNAFARQLLPQLDIEPARGQVLVTSPVDGLPFQGTFHYDEGFYYFRNLGDRVLLGGARNKAFEAENTDQMTTTLEIQQELERFLKEVILPGRNYSIDHRWSGIMGMGSEKMPLLQSVNERVFCAVRMSGMGVALAPLIGERVARLMTGK
ncbi:FAD-dependent oxidoreductase [Flavitalea sp. BT771]|uniref:NAD(P)/FAD-dependent oxidoreductase n=1 Tax=Flavitalea sp. BT771 TaxID=3063329 RepID=UPI0026E48CEE|nr:FAD-dependent oxidoreductase [Flavitalea sp. BT771]MDO6432310.1 FAD-dependent oxidoreductase [Flavitalea sp. BT771]MDV6221220.1 FAD-dependent oxidoreductase [Flavitalea sp. BT771]